MESKRVVPVWVSVILIVLCAVAFFLDFKAFTTTKTFNLYSVAEVADIVAVLMGISYCCEGYKKAAAFLFKAVVYARLFSVAVTIAAQVLYPYTSVPMVVLVIVFCSLIMFSCLSVFAFALDIGKKRSTTMAVILLVIGILLAVINICTDGIAALGTGLTNVMLSVIFLIMVIAKFREKAARGR